MNSAKIIDYQTVLPHLAFAEHRDLRKKQVINFVGVVGIEICLMFTIYELQVHDNTLMALLNAASALFFGAVLLFLKIRRDISAAGTLCLLVFAWIELYLYKFSPVSEFSFVWIIAPIPLIFVLKQARLGRILTIIYATILLGLYVESVPADAFLNLLFSTICITVISYYYESGWEQTELSLMLTVQDLRQKSIVDDLTKLYNRRFFNEVICREISKSRRDAHLLAFFMLDVDNFKLYNDHYGHQKGDAVLAQIGQLLKLHLRRAGDYPFRLGGEEFGGVIHGSSAGEIYMYVDELRARIDALKIEHIHSHNETNITVSIGLTVVPKGLGITEEELYQQSDNQLYRAKSEGRNRTCMAK